MNLPLVYIGGPLYSKEHLDLDFVRLFIDCPFKLMDIRVDPVYDDSVIIMDFVELSDDSTELSSMVRSKISSARNLKLILTHHYKSLSECTIGGMRSLSARLSALNIDFCNLYIITQLDSDIPFIATEFPNSNILVYDKWLNELFDRQVKNVMFTPKSSCIPSTLPYKRFSILCRRYAPERFAIYCNLLDLGLLDSFNYTFSVHSPGMYDPEEVVTDILRDELRTHVPDNIANTNKIHAWIDGLPYKAGLLKADEKADLKISEWPDYPVQLEDYYIQSGVHISMETEPITGASFITEKTYRAMLYMKPFIMISQHQALKKLRQAGYKTFSPFIDESYDELEQYQDRINAVYKEIERLNRLSNDEFHQLLNQCRTVTEHNLKRLYENAYRPISDNFKLSNIVQHSRGVPTTDIRKKLYVNRQFNNHVLLRHPLSKYYSPTSTFIIEDTPISDHSVYMLERFCLNNIHQYVSPTQLNLISSLSDVSMLFVEDFTLPVESTATAIVNLVNQYNIQPAKLWFNVAWNHQKIELENALSVSGIHGVNVRVYNAYLTEIYNQYMQNTQMFKELERVNISTRFGIFSRRFHETRLELFYRLIADNILKHCEYTFTNYHPEFQQEPLMSVNDIKNLDLTNKYSHCRSSINQWIDGLPYCLDESDLRQSFPLKIYEKYSTVGINVVVETLPCHTTDGTYQDIMITEKTWKAIASQKPFMLYAPSGSLDLLKKEGIRTFDSFIDESYDNIDDIQTKQELLVSQLKTLSNLTDAEFYREVNKLSKITNMNLRRFLFLGRQSSNNQIYQELGLIQK